MVSKHSAEVPSDVPKSKKAVLCLTEQMYVLDMLCSGMGYSAVGREFNVNEPTINIKFGV